MLDAIESLGAWWLPGKPERQTIGTLKYAADGGVTLTLMGALVAEPTGPLDRVYDVVHGLLRSSVDGSGQRVTLFDVFVSAMVSTDASWSESYVAVRGFVGHEHLSDQLVRLRSVRASFDSLQTLWDESAIHVDRSVGARGLAIQLDHIPPIEVAVPDGVISIYRGGTVHRRSGNVEIGENVAVTLKPNDPVSVEALDAKWLRPLRYLIGFLTGSSHPDGLRYFARDGTELLPIADWGRLPAHRPRRGDLVMRAMTRDDLGSLVRRWFAFFARRQRFLDAFLGADEPPAYVEPRLLMAFECVRLYAEDENDLDALTAVLVGAPPVTRSIVKHPEKLAKRIAKVREQLWSDNRPPPGDILDMIDRLDWALRASVLGELGEDPEVLREHPGFVALARSEPR